MWTEARLRRLLREYLDRRVHEQADVWLRFQTSIFDDDRIDLTANIGFTARVGTWPIDPACPDHVDAAIVDALNAGLARYSAAHTEVVGGPPDSLTLFVRQVDNFWVLERH